MLSLKVLLLGSPQVEYKGEPVVVDRRKPLALLAYLAITAERHRRDTLATLLWPNSSQTGARASLRRDLSILNKALGEEWLEIDRETVSLRQVPNLWLDVDQFRTGGLEHFEARLECRSHGFVQPLELQRCSMDADTTPPRTLFAGRQVVGHFDVEASRVAGVGPGEYTERESGVANIGGDRPGLVETRGEGDHAVPRNPTVAGL